MNDFTTNMYSGGYDGGYDGGSGSYSRSGGDDYSSNY